MADGNNLNDAAPPLGNEEDEDDNEQAVLDALDTIWDCQFVSKDIATDKWSCGHCGKEWKKINASKALAHVLGIRSSHIKSCQKTIPIPYLNRYIALNQLKEAKKSTKKRANETIQINVQDKQESCVAQLMQQMKKKKTHGKTHQTSITAYPSTVSATVSTGSGMGNMKSKLVQGSLVGSANSDMDFAAADLCHSDNLPFTCFESPRFIRFINLLLSRRVSSDWRPPSKDKIGGALLEINFALTNEHNIKLLLDEAETFGIAFLGDFATIKRMPLLNMLGSPANTPPVVLEVKDCTKQLALGGKKDAKFVSDNFLRHITKLDPQKELTDLLFFDGASNMQIAGNVIAAIYPRITCLHGVEHSIALVFSDWAKIPAIKHLIYITKRLYRVFGSGLSHKPYAQFSAQSRKFHKGRNINLLKGAVTRMASYFYSMHRSLRLRPALLATIHAKAWDSVELTVPIRKAVIDIENEQYWKALYFLLRCVWPALRALRLGDANRSGMHMIYYLSHLTSKHIEQSAGLITDSGLSLLLGNNSKDDDENDFSECGLTDDETIDNNEETVHDENENNSGEESNDDEPVHINVPHESFFMTKVAAVWEKRKSSIDSAYAVTAWALSTLPQIRADVSERLRGNQGNHHLMIESVITKLYAHKIDIDMADTLNTFWNEFKQFQKKTGVSYAIKARWNTPDATNGNSHLWHEKYSLPYTEVLGYVACIVTSKRLGVGSAERSWKDVKQIKSGMASHMRADRIEKQSIIYTTARVEEARIKTVALEDAIDNRQIEWGEDDESFNLDLEKFGINTTELSKPVVPKRKFLCWVEAWEIPLLAKNNIVSMTTLLEKYRDMVFYCPDDKITYTTYGEKLTFCLPKSRHGWSVLGIPEDWDGEDEEQLEPFVIRANIIGEMVKDTKQAQESHIEVVKEEEQHIGSDDFEENMSSSSSSSSTSSDSE